MFRHLLTAVLLCISGTAWSLNLECGPLKENLAQVKFSAKGTSEEVKVIVPKVYEGAGLDGVSVIYGVAQELVAPLELWPADASYSAAYFEVSPNHQRLLVRARFSRGACSFHSLTAIPSWAERHP